MRKVLLPIMSLVCMILCAIVFGIAAQTAAQTVVGEYALGNFYQLVWERGSNLYAQLAFWFLIAASALTLWNLIPTKFRKWTIAANAALFIAAGVFMLLCPSKAESVLKTEATGALVAIAVLTLVAGALNVLMTLVSFKKSAK